MSPVSTSTSTSANPATNEIGVAIARKRVLRDAHQAEARQRVADLRDGVDVLPAARGRRYLSAALDRAPARLAAYVRARVPDRPAAEHALAADVVVVGRPAKLSAPQSPAAFASHPSPRRDSRASSHVSSGCRPTCGLHGRCLLVSPQMTSTLSHGIAGLQRRRARDRSPSACRGYRRPTARTAFRPDGSSSGRRSRSIRRRCGPTATPTPRTFDPCALPGARLTLVPVEQLRHRGRAPA